MTKDHDPILAEPLTAMARHLGIELTGWDAGWAQVEGTLAPHLLNRQELPHGGLHATLLDTAMGYAGCHTGDPALRQHALTLSMTVNYLAQPGGQRLIAQARKTGGGRKTFFAEGSVTDEAGTLIATATGVFRYRGTPGS